MAELSEKKKGFSSLPDDVRESLSHFELNPKLQVGDLVLGVHVYRVLQVPWEKDKSETNISVATVFPRCYACVGKECVHPHIMHYNQDPDGEHADWMVMKLKK